MSVSSTGKTGRLDRLYFVLLFLCVSAALFAAFRLDRHLSSDGVHYFASILDDRAFLRIDRARGFAEELTQAPLVLAVRAGAARVPLLSAVYALGLYLPWVLSISLSLWAVRGENAAALAVPLLAMTCVDLPADALLVGEHHVMVLLAAPILLLILRRAQPTPVDGALLLVALLAFARSYQTAVLPAILFAALLAVRLRHDRSDRRATAIRAVALALSVAAVVIGASSSLIPRDPTNAALFRAWLPMVVRFPETLLLAVSALLLLLALVFRGRAWVLASALATALLLLHVLRDAHRLSALESVGARTLSVTLLPALLLLGVAVKAAEPRLTAARKLVLAGIVAAASLASLYRTAEWGRYRDEMRSILATQAGYVPVEATRVDHHPARWAWTSPQLSVVWSYPVVRAIVLNRADVGWQPFDPLHALLLKRYVAYDPAFAAADPTARFAPPR